MARRGRKPKRRFDLENYKGTLLSAAALFLLVVGVISILSVFAGFSGGSVNSSLRNILVNNFGFAALLIPFILIYGGLIMIGSFKWKFLKYRIFFGGLLFFLGFIGMWGNVLAGKIGGVLQKLTAEYISTPGAVFFYFALLVFSIVLITNIGLKTFIEKITDWVGLIRAKIFGMDLPDNLMEEDEEQKLMNASLEAGHLVQNNPAEPEVVLEEEVIIEQRPRTFEIIRPPSGPVDDDGNLMSKQVEDVEEVEVISSDDDRTSVARLPFSNRVWEYPPISLLNDAPNQEANAGNVQERAQIIEDTLQAFGIKASLADVHIGPAVTQYAINPAIGTKAAKIKNLATDLALRLKSPSGSVRVEAPIPGTNLVGIEVPNFSPSSVSLKSVMESEDMKKSKSKLTIALGHDVAGKPIVRDLSRWPHALIAGSTGSGKSVMLNAIISALLFRCSPQECRFIMIDPKMVELSQYNGIPHLLTPVVTDVEQKAVSAFAWAVSEMERRYKIFANAGVRDLEGYNKLSGFQAEPYIVIVVDELADMMMVAASEVEKYITRLAQKSRATGIHLILATQRPSVNILTGTIKANIPTRIAFKVTSNVDSRVIIDQVGAEVLIGKGDMLFVPPEDSKPRRIQGVWVSDEEISRLVGFLKNTGVEPDYKEEIVQQKVAPAMGGNNTSRGGGDVDPKLLEALEIVINDGKASASYLQRKLALGYSRAARMVDEMQDAGVIGEARGSKPRDVLVASVEEAIERMTGVSSSAGVDNENNE